MRHTDSNPLYLVYFVGYPGSGKSSFARALAKDGGAVLLNADAIRLSMFGDHAAADDVLRQDEQRYYDDVYGALSYCAQQVLASGTSAIVDGQLSRHTYRQRLQGIAGIAHAIPVLVEMRTSRDTAMRRALARTVSGDSRRFTDAEIASVFDYAERRLQKPGPEEPLLPLAGDVDVTRQLQRFYSYLDQSATRAA